MIQSKARLQSRVIKAITVDDVALLYTDFQGTAVDPSGKTIEVRYNAVEVLRRQFDGAWKLIVGDPNGRAREARHERDVTNKTPSSPSPARSFGGMSPRRLSR
jgi:hypothetical protein